MPDMPETDCDVIIVGAGVAGGALATALARDGRSVLLIERYLYTRDALNNPVHTQLAEPERIVGELLQPGGYAALVELGLREAVEHIDAQNIYGYGIFLNSEASCIDYAPPSFRSISPRGRVAGRSFHNGRFLRRLRELASAEPLLTLVEGTVVSLETDETGRVIGVAYRSQDGIRKTAYASLTIACDGCASSLRKRANPDARPAVASTFVGLLLELTDVPFPSHGHVVLADPAPILFYPVSSTHVRCLVDIPSSHAALDRTDHMMNNLAPQVPPPLRGAFEEAVRKGGSRAMPNRVMPAAPAIVPGAILLGDSFNMRHPLTGGGMTVALSDVRIIRSLLREVTDLSDEGEVSKSLELFYEKRKPLSTTINILANALYAVFCATNDPALVDMRSACFDYLGRGGRMTHDPMALIGGVKPHPLLLVAHFFMVALYGCGRALLPCPTLSRIMKAWAIFKASFNIVKPLIDDEDLKPLSWLPFTSL